MGFKRMAAMLVSAQKEADMMRFITQTLLLGRTGLLFGPTALLLLCPRVVQAEPEPTWGAPTNALRLGVSVAPETVWRTTNYSKPLCVMYLQNVGTNRIVRRFPSAESRHDMQLSGPDGRSCEMRPYVDVHIRELMWT